MREVDNPFQETVTGKNYVNNRVVQHGSTIASHNSGIYAGLVETLSKKLLPAIAACEEEVGGAKNRDLLCLTKAQLVKAFGKRALSIPAHETEAYFDENAVGTRFYYREVLMS